MADNQETDKERCPTSSPARRRTWLTRNWTEEDFKEVEFTRRWNKEFSNAPLYLLAVSFIFIMWYEFLK
ncbi:hypothetical protein [Burkholderia sp. BCC1977]|uniref:hypothetical protein n=1 Tax=Burkholderia sp. BCC1977 TaxID=2817440 RepID=UPI002ABE24C9|nr:hypothetical protein [Burkholderia sp. BCC1977]